MGINDQRVKENAKKLKHPLYTALIASVISLNSLIAIDIVFTNQTTKKINEEITELNKKQTKTIRESQELNEQLKEALNRHY